MKVISVILLIVLLSGLAESKYGWKKKKSPHWNKNEEHESGNQEIDKEKDKENNNGQGGNNEHNQGGNNGQNQSSNNGQNQGGNGGQNQGDKDPYRQEISDDPETAFQDLSHLIIAYDNLTSKYCEKNSHSGATEVYGTYNYKLFIPLKNLDMDLIQVKIKHRVMYIKGEVPEIDPRWQGNDDAHFNDIRRLAEFLDVKKATWTLKGTRIEITIPYKFFFNKEMNKTCEADYKTDDTEFIVPEGTGKPDINQSIIDNIFGSNDKNLGNRMSDDETPSTTEHRLVLE